MRGRKPNPTAKRMLEGNPGKRPLNFNEPILPPIDPSVFDAPPPELDHNPVAQAEWKYLAPKLRRAKHVTAGDKGALIALCIEWARYLEAMAQVHRRGMVVPAPSGYPIPNPYLAIGTRALQACIKLWPELGLTPSSRSRVSVASDGDTDDGFNEFDEPPPSIQ